MKRIVLFAAILAVLISGLLPAAAQGAIPAGLRVNGVEVERANGDRFIFAGANVEMYRDYRLGKGMGAACNYASDGFYSVRVEMADRLASLGVNAIRLNYKYSNLDATNLAKFLDVAQAFIARGLYVMPSDHSYTGGALTSASASYPMMKAILDGLRARAVNMDFVIMNPWNEPGPDITAAAWVLAQQKVIDYLRNTAQFDGLIVLDGTGWATMLDAARFKGLIEFDAQKRTDAARAVDPGAGVQPGKLVFSHHLYPNIGFEGLPTSIGRAAGDVPLVVGELGQYNETPDTPTYVTRVIGAALNEWIPAGHNGLFSWIVNWCDSNKQLFDWTKNPGVPYSPDESFTTYGLLWNREYFGKFAPVNSPDGTPISTARPPLPTNTPRPATATARSSATPIQPTATPRASGTPAATPVCTRRQHIVGTFNGAAVDIWIEDCT